MTFVLKYPANWRYCGKCKRWRPNKGGRFKPFCCADCIAKESKPDELAQERAKFSALMDQYMALKGEHEMLLKEILEPNTKNPSCGGA